jgi:putative ABC transport system ATP-binding protein
MLEAKEISLKYKDGESWLNAVTDLSLVVKPRQFIGILGPSGSGKSSLLYLLSGIRKADKGEIIFDGRSYNTMTEQERVALRRYRFGFVFQQHFLINYLTVLENIMVAAPIHNDVYFKRAKTLLGELGLSGKEDRFIHELSGGERQRVAVGRAIIHNPSIIFADEPTGLLDSRTGAIVVDLLRACCREGCLIVVTHNPSILTSADLIVKMDDGRMTDCIENTRTGEIK